MITTSKRQSRTLKELIRDYGLYLLISVVFITGAIVPLLCGLALEPWLGSYFFLTATLYVFGQFLASNRKVWRPSFIAWTIGLFAAQLSAFVLWTLHGGRVGKSAFWWIAVGAAERLPLNWMKALLIGPDERPDHQLPTLL